MNDRFISVCVLSYNRRDFLTRSIESMIETADEPLEIIVHDDGSAREGEWATADECVRLWLIDAVDAGRISRLILNPPGHNEGQGVALNRMFHMAKGDILVKADQDLIYKPGWTKAIRETIDQSRASWNDHDRGFPKIGALGLFKYHVEPVHYQDMYVESVRVGDVEWDECKDFVGSLIAMPREAWEEFGPWEERSPAFAEDAVMKQQITASSNWCCALTPEDYVENVGFGVGPSTLVEGFDEKGDGILAQIEPGPHLVTNERTG